jgi:hypothetical protein
MTLPMITVTRKNFVRKIFVPILIILAVCAGFAAHQLLAPTKASAPLSVLTHPDGALYVGDQVSFEVFNPSASEPASDSLMISLSGKTLAVENFAPFGMGGRSQATFYWAWNTRGLNPGDYTLTFSLLPGQTHWDEKITLLPAAGVPSPEPEARWESVEIPCCVISYISGTDAEKDSEALKTMAAAQAADVERRLGAKYAQKIPLTFLPRTLGQGGFTSDGIYVSYLHQNYAGSTIQQIVHHEMVHWLDNQLGGRMRPSILEEGLAVYLSDGHFKVEPILPRTAAIIDLGWYIPLRQLTNSFYISQHEVGYAEAAALISYMVNTYGWDEFNRFYRDIRPASSGLQADAFDAALQAHFSISLDQLEKNFIVFLHKQTVPDSVRTDIRLTVTFYDAVRRYEYELDPSAYFLNTWLPDVSQMRQRGIVADFVRHPDSLLNQQIETLLVSANADLLAANYATAENKIKTVNTLLGLKKYLGN